MHIPYFTLLTALPHKRAGVYSTTLLQIRPPRIVRGSLHGWHRHTDPPRQRRTLNGASDHEPGGERGERDLSSHVIEALPSVGNGAEGEEARLAVELSEATVLEDRTHLTMHRAAGSTDT